VHQFLPHFVPQRLARWHIIAPTGRHGRNGIVVELTCPQKPASHSEQDKSIPSISSPQAGDSLASVENMSFVS
jgi:hypothetical protein